MPRKSVKRGMIIVVCPFCRYIFALYDLDPKSTRHRGDKYRGAPMPIAGARYYDAEVYEDGTVRCPNCGARLEAVPARVIIGKYKKLSKVIDIDEVSNRLIIKSRKLLSEIMGVIPKYINIDVGEFGADMAMAEESSEGEAATVSG